MRARSNLAFGALVAAIAGTLLGCGKINPSGNPADAKSANAAEALSQGDPNVDVGPPLFLRKDLPKYPPAAAPGTEPLVIPNCIVQYDERQQVSAEVDGKIDLIATRFDRKEGGAEVTVDLAPNDGVVRKEAVRETIRPPVWEFQPRDGGPVVTHDPVAFASPAFDPTKLHPNIVFNPRDQAAYPDKVGGQAWPQNRVKWVPYWKLAEGDRVLAGQYLCFLDDSLIAIKRDTAERVKKDAALGLGAAKAGVKASQEKIDMVKGKEGTLSKREQLDDLITLNRFVENLANSAQAITKAEGDFSEAAETLRRHHITSRVTGIIRNVAKRPGEYVRAGEKIFEIQSTEKVRLEGGLDVQYYDLVLQAKRANQEVTVEPAIPRPPIRSHASHSMDVAAVAVGGMGDRPLVVSVGLDGKALVWEPNLAGAAGRPAYQHNLPHPVAVRAVVCTPPGVKPALAITGADDGKVRIWDISDPGRLPNAAREPGDAHASGVTAVAVSEDGRFAATAAGREVFVWDLAAGRKLYALPAEHRDTVTAVAFTREAKLVTAARDKTMKVWKLGAEKAAVARTIDHRSGVVDGLGVSPDGGRVLFDQDKGRLDLVDLTNGQTVGQISNLGPGAAFGALAAFAPDSGNPADPYRIVTAGGEGDLKGGLQVWELPKAGGRGAEIARLVTPGRAPVTCAAFSSHKDAKFVVVGTDKGSVHVWTPSAGPSEKLKGRIAVIDAADPRYVTVRVEMGNKGLDLRDRSAATVIISPGP